MEATACDICSERHFDVVREDRWVAPETGRWYPIITCVCRGCGHVYLNPWLSFDELEEFYKSNKHLSFQVSRGESKGLNAADIAFLGDTVGPGAGRPALEVGCYSGYMLARLAAAGWCVEGVEPNADSADAARRLTGLKIHETMFEKLATDRRYALLVMGGLIEHVQSPTAILLKANSLLERDGALYVRTPNIEDLGYESAADLFVLEHPHVFSKSTMRMLFQKTGFRVVAQHVHPLFPRSFVTVGRKVGDADGPQAFTVESQRQKVLAALAGYDRQVAHHRHEVDRRLDPFLGDPRPPVAVFGAGSHTGLLLQHTRLRDLNIVCVLDSDPRKWGGSAFGIPVESPETFDRQRVRAIIISSRAFQEEIHARIAHWQVDGPAIVRLYDLQGSRFEHE